MNTITLSGRTVRVSDEFKTNSDGKLTYVTIAVRNRIKEQKRKKALAKGNKYDESTDDFFTLKMYNGLSKVAQEHLNISDPAKVKDDNVKNNIHSRIISVTGTLNVYQKETEYIVPIDGENKKILFDETNVNVMVQDITLLDKTPEFAKATKATKATKTSKASKATKATPAKASKATSNKASANEEPESGTIIDDEEIPA